MMRTTEVHRSELWFECRILMLTFGVKTHRYQTAGHVPVLCRKVRDTHSYDSVPQDLREVLPLSTQEDGTEFESTLYALWCESSTAKMGGVGKRFLQDKLPTLSWCTCTVCKDNRTEKATHSYYFEHSRSQTAPTMSHKAFISTEPWAVSRRL